MDKTAYATPNVKVWIYNAHTFMCNGRIFLLDFRPALY